ncbi:MAG: hypothetical protein IKH30_18305 [Clostridia bacterium]|nr:hypothetical protein [Clostridia bacterium]
MNVKAILREYRKGTRPDSIFMKGCMDMYRVSGDPLYRDEVLNAVNTMVSTDGELNVQEPVKTMLSCGKALLFAYDQTGEERYKTAAGKLREALRKTDLSTAWDLYLICPFIAEYDTRFMDKQSYKAIARCFQTTVRAHSLPGEKEQCYMLMALVDTIEQMDIQLYEHHRVLADLLLEIARKLVPYWQERFTLFAKETEKPNETEMESCLMTAYSVLKGVRLGLLDDEKYLPAIGYMVYAMEYVGGSHIAFREFPARPGLGLMLQAEMEEAGER